MLPTRGLAQHLLLTLKLNLRSRQALVYGYLVPIFFLIAFGSLFRTQPPLVRELGQLLTITTLGGACFGMPTAMVAERERGVWRRYRLLPAGAGGIVLSTMVARLLIVASAAVLQIALAMGFYRMPAPAMPVELAVAFVFVAFAFLGMGLVIAMLADAVPAVQAMGQCIFLPMIIIGGVGVPLATLPVWARHVAGFLPGIYAVEALQACVAPEAVRHLAGLGDVTFDLIALLLFGIAGCAAGVKLFRWDAGQKVLASTRGWALLAIVPWAAVGVAAEVSGRLGSPRVVVTEIAPPQTMPAVASPATVPAATVLTTTVSATAPADSRALTDADVARITFDNLEPDTSTVTPVARDLDGLDEPGKVVIDRLREKLADWPPGHEADPVVRVRNLLAVAGVVDILRDPYEAEVPLIVFRQIRLDTPASDLPRVLAWIILHPDEGAVPTSLPALGWDAELTQAEVHERCALYAAKLLGRLEGKLPKPAKQ